MRRFVRRHLLMLISTVFCIGCSIKENRKDCPCRLSLDFSQVDCSLVDSLVVKVFSGNAIVDTAKVYSDAFDEKLLLMLPRSSHIKISALSGFENFVMNNGNLLIPIGKDCSPVFMYLDMLNSDCEELEKIVELKKNFCRLKIVVKDEENFPFELELRGKVDGYLADGQPSEGEFRYSPSEVENNNYFVYLPRQLDGSLMLDVNDGTDVLKTFALGEYILASGYDWNEDDLKDITVGIDYARTSLSVVIQGWDKVFEFDFVI